MTPSPQHISRHWTPNHENISEARERARAVLASPTAAENLARYYASDSNYAGRTFVDLAPNEPYAITAADLLAVTTLSVQIGPHAIRTFELMTAELSEKLGSLDPDLRLESMDPATTAEAMASFYELVKKSLKRAGAATSNAWVTASKICARKRPYLFPVRDNVVLELLGLPKTYPVDWPAFQALIDDELIVRTLDDRIAAATRIAETDLGEPSLRLRHLDVVLWMHAMTRTSA